MPPFHHALTRRVFLGTSAATLGLYAVAPALGQTTASQPANYRIYKSLKWGMVQAPGMTLADVFAMLREVGFDGVELDSPTTMDMQEVCKAAEQVGFRIDGVVDSRHWQVRLTDPDAGRRQQALEDLLTAIRDTHTVGGHTVLLVPGVGDDGTREDVWKRATEQIWQAIPVAAELGIVIAIENVWNKMFYDHDGPDNQTADELARFVDQFASPWVAVQFDIGNHQKYGRPAAWIRTLGKRIVKLDVKDWGRSTGFCRIGEGDVDWPAVRQALSDIRFHGWAAAEVEGGGREQLQRISQEMDSVLGVESSR